MAFKDFPAQQQGIELLQRSLVRGRLAHAYLFAGQQLDELEALARTLAQTLNCQTPQRQDGAPLDCCDRCLPCRKIAHGNHPDVHWVRPESKLQTIKVEPMRDLMKEIQLKPAEAEFKVAVIVAADRLGLAAGNAFLKTLEEPPPKSILILLSTEPQRLLETILSRCLRLNFGGDGLRRLTPAQSQWLTAFSDLAAAGQKSLLGRYRLLDVLLRQLTEMKAVIEKNLTARSPSQLYKEAEPELIERWEKELAAAIETEYRRQRADLLGLLHWWLRDIWLRTLVQSPELEVQRPTSNVQSPETAGLLSFPEVLGTEKIAQRISTAEALENLQVLEQLQRWLGTNVQEALTLEVALLKLRL